jgi:hypothetical protein
MENFIVGLSAPSTNNLEQADDYTKHILRDFFGSWAPGAPDYINMLQSTQPVNDLRGVLTVTNCCITISSFQCTINLLEHNMISSSAYLDTHFPPLFVNL